MSKSVTYHWGTTAMSVPWLAVACLCVHYQHGWWALVFMILAGAHRKDLK